MTGTSSDVAFADAYVKGVAASTPSDAYDAALKNATVAPPGRPERHERRPQGPADRRSSSATRRTRRRRGRVVGARGLHQRLRHRQHGRRSSPPTERRTATAQAALPGGVRVLPQPRAELREHVRPGGRLLPGPRRRRATGSRRPRSTTRASGATSTTTPRPTAGTSRSTRRRTARASRTSTAAATASRRSSTRSSRRPETAKFPGSYGGIIHEMIEARDVRMGQWGFSQPGLAPHPVHVRLRGPAVRRPQEKVREALRRLYLGSEIGQGYAGDEDNGETSAWYLFSALGFYPLQVGSAELRDRLAAVHEGDGAPGERPATSSSTRRTTARKNVYVQGLKRQRQGATTRAYLAHADIAERRHDRRSTWARSRRSGRPAPDAAPPSITTERQRSPQPLRDALGGGSGDGDGEQRRRAGGAVRRQLGHRGRARRRAPVDPVPLRRRREAAGALLHADVRHRRRGGRPARLGREGLERRQLAGRCSTSAAARRSRGARRRAPFKLDAPGQLRVLPDRGDRERRRRVDDARRDRAAQQRRSRRRSR